MIELWWKNWIASEHEFGDRSGTFCAVCSILHKSLALQEHGTLGPTIPIWVNTEMCWGSSKANVGKKMKLNISKWQNGWRAEKFEEKRCTLPQFNPSQSIVSIIPSCHLFQLFHSLKDYGESTAFQSKNHYVPAPKKHKVSIPSTLTIKNQRKTECSNVEDIAIGSSTMPSSSLPFPALGKSSPLHCSGEV